MSKTSELKPTELSLIKKAEQLFNNPALKLFKLDLNPESSGTL
jgi:hypothetical protein